MATDHNTHEAFWEFSLKVYSDPVVKQALLYLQDEYHLNVNILLFASYLGFVRQHPLNDAALERIFDNLYRWSAIITLPLRHLRRRIHKHSKPLLRQLGLDLLNVELEAEYAEQRLIRKCVDVPKKNHVHASDPYHIAADNIQAYLRIKHVVLTKQEKHYVTGLLNGIQYQLNERTRYSDHESVQTS